MKNILLLLLCILCLPACSLTKKVVYFQRWDCNQKVIGNRENVYRVSIRLPLDYELAHVVYGEGLGVDGEYYFISSSDSSTVYIIGYQPGLYDWIQGKESGVKNEPEHMLRQGNCSEFKFRNILYGYRNVQMGRLNEMDEVMQQVTIDSILIHTNKLTRREQRIISTLTDN